MSKTKILYIITKSNFGGAQRYVYDLATKLPRGDFDVAVAMGGDGGLKDKLNEAGIKTIRIDRLGRNINIFDDVAVFFNLFKLFRKEMPDVIHLNSSKIGGLGALAARFARVPRIVFTAHGWAFNETRSGWQKVSIKMLSWLTVFLCHSVITVSERDGKQGREMPFFGKKIVVVHNGVSKIDFKSKEAARGDILGALGSRTTKLAGETVWLGTIAELHKNKGLEYAIQAIAYLGKDRPSLVWEGRSFPRFVFAVIGEGEQRENLEDLIKKYGLKKNIFLVGYKKNAPSLLKAFDVFILPSIKEGLPYVLLEAGMAGLPSIASDTGGIPEIIDDMESGILLQPGNSKEIAKAITYLKENNDKMREFGQKLHEKVTENFSTNQMLEKTMKIYTI
jgi:glycosyltransferase involved in cell wall biosynthesis